MSDDLEQQFQQAGAEVQQLSKAPANETMLTLYALFKQGTKGDCTGARPGMMDFVGRAKYDAWKALAGKAPNAAKEEYVALVERLKAEDAGGS